MYRKNKFNKGRIWHMVDKVLYFEVGTTLCQILCAMLVVHIQLSFVSSGKHSNCCIKLYSLSKVVDSVCNAAA